MLANSIGFSQKYVRVHTGNTPVLGVLGVCSEFGFVDVQTMKESMRVVGFCKFSQVLNVFFLMFFYVLLAFVILYCVESVFECFASVRFFFIVFKVFGCVLCA